MAPRLSPEARALLAAQRGLLADWQLEDVRLSRRRAWNGTRDGWVQVTPHVVCDRDATLTRAQMRFAAVLDAGPRAMLAGCSALVEIGWSGTESDFVDVIVPRGQRFRARGRPRWIRAHQPRAEPTRRGHPARTSASRAAIDAAGWARSDREAMMILTSVVQQGLTTADQISRELSRQSLPTRAALIRGILVDLRGGATSSNEVAFRRECRRRGLPAPRMQTRRNGSRVTRTDAEFQLADGRLLIVEIDGIGHLDAASWHDDIARHNDLATTTGALILRVTGWAVRSDPDPFFGMLTGLPIIAW
jgi:very-short-patch-repair endonuclease